ncbi:MAG: methyl-accepting chemotaxis protein [Lachnospiraceae bacterium]|nr:methyl-accepting chemotaxis protein [Lachnospiraceae bacterium]
MPKKMKSIKMKLIGSIVSIVIAMIIVLVTFSYGKSANVIEEYSEELLSSSVGNQTAQIEAWLKENISSFQMVKTTIEKMHFNDAQIQKILDSFYNYNSNYPQGIYIGDTTGKVMKATEASISVNNIHDEVWYKEGLTRVNMAVSSPYVNSAGEKVISVSGILNDGKNKKSVISADMSLDRISIIVNSFIEMKHAEAFLVDKNSNVILAHRDSTIISKKLEEQTDNAFLLQVAEKINVQDYDFCTIEDNMTVFEEIAGTNWVLVSYIPTKVVLIDLIHLRTLMIIISAVSIIVLCIVTERITQVVVGPVKKLTSAIIDMADGDFTVSIESKGSDEIAVMSNSVVDFIKSMRSMIISIGDISSKLGSQAETNDAVSAEMQNAASVQSESMSELNSTVDQLSLSVNEIADNATKLASVVADTKADSVGVENKMQETVSVSKKGRQDMEYVGKALGDIQTSIQNLEQAVNKVGIASNEIVEIVQLIGNIADETNLLSLNASIEAARAGEAGKGFAVVASEIGNLANSSADSVAHISKLIDEVRDLVDDAVKQAGNSAEDINESSVLIHSAIDTFENIYANIAETSDLIEHMIEKINQVDQVATNVAAISQEQAASTEEILATSETMLQQAKGIAENSKQVADESKSLTVSSEKLSQQVKKFRI